MAGCLIVLGTALAFAPPSFVPRRIAPRARALVVAALENEPHGKLILVRHGQSEWNLANLFTGWVDVDLTEQGISEAREAGRLMLAAGLVVDEVHTDDVKNAFLFSLGRGLDTAGASTFRGNANGNYECCAGCAAQPVGVVVGHALLGLRAAQPVWQGGGRGGEGDDDEQDARHERESQARPLVARLSRRAAA